MRVHLCNGRQGCDGREVEPVDRDEANEEAETLWLWRLAEEAWRGSCVMGVTRVMCYWG